ncbi:MAG: cyclic nucleotide-binding domain-containing protein [Chloroflexi bacterium]|nr:cyclic nucleotide-binding domain-containing protein [Chloroflexota bacterium]
MSLKQALLGIELFEGLSDSELEAVITLCEERSYSKGDIIAEQGNPGNEFYIIIEGFAEISVDSEQDAPRKLVVNLGSGQTAGEMSLVDQGPRSATIRAINNPTTVQVIQQEAFAELCENNHKIGYIVMRNIAADLSFRLRQRHLSDLG